MKYLGLLFFLTIIGYAIWQVCSSASEASTTHRQWLNTEAKVLETRTQVRRRGSYTYAKVSFTAEDGNRYLTEVKLWSIPLVGRVLSPDDTISILYDAKNPVVALSPLAHYLDTYGLYILIGAGIFFSALRLRKAYKLK